MNNKEKKSNLYEEMFEKYRKENKFVNKKTSLWENLFYTFLLIYGLAYLIIVLPQSSLLTVLA